MGAATECSKLSSRRIPAQLETMTVVADLLAPFLASLELSEDLAGEVATQSREIEEHRRFTSLVIDSLPVGLYVVDRSYRIQTWNRKRETGTQGLRRDDVVGRPVFEVLTRQPPDAAQGGVRPGLPDRRDPAERAGSDAGRGAALVPAEQDSHAPRGRRDHPRHHDRRGRDRLARDAEADHADREARRDRAAGGRHHARDQQPARHDQRLRRGDSGRPGFVAGRVPRHHRPRGRALQPDHRRPARLQPAEGDDEERAGRTQRAGRGVAVAAAAPPAVQAARRRPGARSRLPAHDRRRRAAAPGAHGADAERGGRDGAERRPAHGADGADADAGRGRGGRGDRYRRRYASAPS